MFLHAHEIVMNYHKVEGPARCTIKVDLMTAYESVDWNFIFHCLSAIGFPPM